jgi:hypothetical protein
MKAEKKITKRRLRVKRSYKNTTVVSFESTNWGFSSDDKRLKIHPIRPAWMVNRLSCRLDLNFEGVAEIQLNKEHNPNLIAIFCNKIVNKYYSNKIEITSEIRLQIIQEVESFIQKTGDVFERL